MVSLTEGDAFALLTGVRNGLNTDGYDLEVVEAGQSLTVRIVAGADACEDCLVGPPVMKNIIASAIREMDVSFSDDQVSVLYPAGSWAH